jgi:hypothetical protein
VTFGVAGSGVVAITLVEPNGRRSALPLQRGAFVVARPGEGLSGARLDVVMKDGSTITRDLR